MKIIVEKSNKSVRLDSLAPGESCIYANREANDIQTVLRKDHAFFRNNLESNQVPIFSHNNKGLGWDYAETLVRKVVITEVKANEY